MIFPEHEKLAKLEADACFQEMVKFVRWLSDSEHSTHQFKGRIFLCRIGAHGIPYPISEVAKEIVGSYFWIDWAKYSEETQLKEVV